MSADLTRRLYAAADTIGPGVSRHEVAVVVCRELAEFLHEEAVMFNAKASATRHGPRELSAGDLAHRDVIGQIADLLGRVGDERMSS